MRSARRGAARRPTRRPAMLVLDENHLCELSYQSDLGVRLRGRLDASSEDIVTTVVAAEELLKGRLARVAAARDVREQVLSYERLAETISFIADYTLLLSDAAVPARFYRFRA